jgi:hypothetical protein
MGFNFDGLSREDFRRSMQELLGKWESPEHLFKDRRIPRNPVSRRPVFCLRYL